MVFKSIYENFKQSFFISGVLHRTDKHTNLQYLALFIKETFVNNTEAQTFFISFSCFLHLLQERSHLFSKFDVVPISVSTNANTPVTIDACRNLKEARKTEISPS